MKSAKIENGINGEIKIPGDKSISHRSIIIPSISKGICEITNILKSEDVLHTLNAFKLMGVKIKEIEDRIIIYGNGITSLKKPNDKIYLGNSGTSARLLTGLLASQNFNSILTGDRSLSSRPMKRIADPLSLMNAKIQTSDGKMPIKIFGKNLKNSKITVDIASAQIKSGLILAALNTKGKTTIIEKNITRNHTEIMLESFGANIEIQKIYNENFIEIVGKKEIIPQNIQVPSDLSSSAFFIVAALINKNSNITLKNININPTRSGVLIALNKMGANINITNKRILNNENVADINVQSSELNGCELDKDIAKLMIDEYPIMSIAAAFAKSPSIFRGLSELRVKESDRLNLIATNLKNCGCNCKIENDDLFISPITKKEIFLPNIKTNFDHRIAMAFLVMGSRLEEIKIDNSDSIKTSFPKFVDEFNSAGGRIY
ncbi:MAG: 3-phosphoshikimate 1-carboxyvinyltransferase [Alphaproteobacteria bacterium MarineAlpha5_Bin5]|nr:MAG: 3-phosphoshikimate 1-carboxyvinyltransferase [Alphaproteobacteria bacterium MarineAlpha5_Bin5]PPR52338.1 MAG: 3-phosphoshikimate 1-carboxyvinyltransferase [Alphaproteobacteria bacterium MarineAlpha5_Bin4]|tara:strand:- start:9104 stop:10402 length:1299 start_codon:yes stop_codon:yes gene_type:complete